MHIPELGNDRLAPQIHARRNHASGPFLLPMSFKVPRKTLEDSRRQNEMHDWRCNEAMVHAMVRCHPIQQLC